MTIKKNWKFLYSGMTVLADLLGAWSAVHLSWWLWFDLISFSPVHRPSEHPLKMMVVVVFGTALVLGGGYRRIFKKSIDDQWVEIYKTALYSLLITAAWVFATKGYNYSRGFIIAYFFIVPAILSLVRLALYRIRIQLMKSGWGVKNALIIGNSQTARDIIDQLALHHTFGYKIVGILTENSQDLNFSYRGIKAIGLSGECDRVVRQYEVSQVFIPDLSGELTDYNLLIASCRRLDVEVRVVSHQTDLLARVAGIYDMAGISLLERRGRTLTTVYAILKRAGDILASGMGLVVCSPFFAVIAAVIRLDSPGAVFFKQERVKKGGKPFQLYKFRTMFLGSEGIKDELAGQNELEGPIFKTRQDPRITRAGRWLRRLSLDELPQLINVFKGEMSLVGPRPPLPSEVEHYQEWHKYRLNGPQGMTGLWQVSGRSELSFEEMVLLDIYYLEYSSPLMDLEILIKTIPAVITAKGAY
jgi:exopolysaccharide biosynthesis polyprenyl glycosylphosphotransferase